jgi:ParB-like chromosome segregation protein Spo0J
VTPSIDLTGDVFKMEGAKPAIQSSTAVATTGITERSIVVGGAVTPMTTVNNVPIGRAVGNLLMVYVAQLRLPDDGGLRRNYNPDEDEAFDGLRDSIEQTNKCNIDPMLCEVTDEMVEIDGEQRPIVIVRAGERRFYALTRLGAPEALIRILPRNPEARMVTLVSLITNEMREPLSILDKAAVIAMLIDMYGLKQHVVAQHVGYSQPMVSRLYMLDRQPPLIKTYAANESLGLESIGALNRRFEDDPTLRELAARYIVQEGGRVSVSDLANQIAPPSGIAITGNLSIQDDIVVLTPIGLAAPKQREAALRLADDTPAKPLSYWKRGYPLKALPARILEHHHAVEISGTPSDVQVALRTLHTTALFQMVQRQETVDVAALEEAMLSDLEAIREALEKQPKA